MTYYIIVDGWTAIKTFDNLRGAKTSLTRKYIKMYPNAVIMNAEEFKQHKQNEPIRKVRHLLTGEMVDEKISTPYYLSVSSETYWST